MIVNRAFLATATSVLALTASASEVACGAGGTNAPPAAAVQSTAVEVPSAANAARVAKVLAQPDRKADDRALDGPRQATEVLAYLDVSPGMDVAILAPGSGYFMELVARSIGIDGRLFARNPPSILAESGLGQAWDARLARPAGARVVRIDDELGKQLSVYGLDLVFLDHDYASLGARSAAPSAIDASVWNALKQDGRFVVVEREAAATETRRTIESHGFRLAGEGRFLRRGATPSDWGDDQRLAAGEKQLLLTFVKP
jgi:predicted methyltransferase